MEIKFVTREENGKIVVVYIRDGIEVAKFETADPLQTIISLLTLSRRVRAEPHMIFEIEVKITGAEIGFINN